MGVRGLSTYIYNNSNKFFDSYMLQNCDVVIDGNCLVSVLFQNSITNTAAFGGDYDRYAKAIEYFFTHLLKCNINPLVIFDGGYEKKKFQTVRTRNKDKMMSLCDIGPSKHSKVCFPLMMRQCFRDKLKEMSILYAQSDFEADREIAALARKLQCPVLSNDSDFFIYDVMLIPVHNFSLEADIKEDGSYYMSCLVYKVEHFLRHLGGLPRSHLPLLAVLLGNDYISGGTFANFYSQMKITRGRKLVQVQHRVKAVISWLKKESFESALKKILWHFKKNKQRMFAMKIGRIIQDYCQVSTSLNSYLLQRDIKHSDIEILHVEDILKEYDSVDGTCEDEEIDNQFDSSECDSVCETDENQKICDEELDETPLFDSNEQQNDSANNSVCVKSTNADNLKVLETNSKLLPHWLIEYSRRGDIPSCIITLYSLKVYFCVPQVENYDMNHAGEIGIPLLSKIAGIILGDDIYSYHHRSHKLRYICTKLSTITSCSNKKFPSLSSINQLNCSQRKSLFLDIFEIPPEFLDVVNNFPENWHLFLYSLIYWTKNMKEPNFQLYYFHSVIVMILCVRVIESKIGYFRNKKPFMQRYASKLKKYNITSFSTDSSLNIESIIEMVPLEECLMAFEIFLPYFQIADTLKTNAKLFNRNSIHSLVQFQVCIDLAYILNSLLLSPLTSLPIYNFFNATYLYNICCLLKKRINIMAYLETLLVKCPNLLHLYKKMIDCLSPIMLIHDKSDIGSVKKCKKKKKKPKKCSITVSDINIEENSDSTYSDEDNTFSLLSKLEIK